MRKIECSNPKCDGVVAHIIGNQTLELKRQKNQITLHGSDFSCMATCGKCGERTALYIEDGHLVEEGVTFKEEPGLTPEQQAEVDRQEAERKAREQGVEDDALNPKPNPDEPKPDDVIPPTDPLPQPAGPTPRLVPKA